MENSDTADIEPASAGTKLSRMGLASLIVAAAAIPLFYVSIHRINSLNENNPDVCLVRDTSFYNTIHTLCAILPAASATLATLSLMRCQRNKTCFAAAIPALAGLLLAVVSFAIYFLVLSALARSHSH